MRRVVVLSQPARGLSRRFIFSVTLGLAAAAGLVGKARSAHAQTEDVLGSLGRTVDANPSPATYDAFAQAAFRVRRWDEAIARLKEGTARLPAYHQGWYKLGYAYRQRRAFGEAAAAYRKFSELEPTQADPYFGLGAALEGTGDKAGAVDAYRRYIELEKAPDKQKFVAQARAQVDKLVLPPVVQAPSAVSRMPAPLLPRAMPPLAAAPSSSALSLRAEADKLRRAGKLDDAGRAFERALAADPGNLDLHVELGDVYFSQKRYPDAARIFRAAVERDPGYALGWYNLAHAEAQAGDHKSAVASYRAYIQLRPSDPDPYYGLGHACKAAGDRQGAIDAFRTYLQMERRPELQRWIDRARKELHELGDTAERSKLRDLMNPFERPRNHDLKKPLDDRVGYASNDDILPAYDVEPDTVRDHLRIAREVASDDILPITLDDVLDDDLIAVDAHIPKDQRECLARYAAALAAYRAALEHEANEAALLYQRGADRLMVADLRGAQRVWTQLPSDRGIDEARQRLEKARQAITKQQ